MVKHRKPDDYTVPDPWHVVLRELIAKYVVCPIAGHKPVQKFTGVIPCRRHD